VSRGFVNRNSSVSTSECGAFKLHCTQFAHKGAFHTPMDEILTPSQVAERLQVKPSWVYEQTRVRAEVRNADPLPHMKMGRYLRFDWEDVVDWLERRKSDFEPRSPSHTEGN
jgi:predicted DNA-binding transcriptional regulator AlpA